MHKQTTISDFTILQKLGEGSFGQVFKVKRNSDSQEYAMKKVKLGPLRQKEKENALNEIRILASIIDPHIVAYKEAFLDEPTNQLCVIMEFAADGDIQKQISTAIKRSQLIEENEIWKALVHMTLGLRVLHKAGILHRDLKSANVFKSQDGSYKIGDLNVSKVSYGALAKTQTGTPYYASPEVWRDQPYSSPSDIWSLGCVIYEMATLKPPFRATDLKQLFRKVSSGIYDKLPKTYSQDLQNIISALLKVPPHLRPTCDQILNDPVVKQHTEELLPHNNEQQINKAELLQTIMLPKNLKQLQAKLPKPMYDVNKISNPLLKNQPKSTRSVSVNEQGSSERPKSQTPQIQRKEPYISQNNQNKPKIPLGPKSNQQPPILPKGYQPQQQVANRPNSGIRALSPVPSRKSCDRKPTECYNNNNYRNQSPQNKARYNNRINDENIDRNRLGPRKQSAQQLRKPL